MAHSTCIHIAGFDYVAAGHMLVIEISSGDKDGLKLDK